MTNSYRSELRQYKRMMSDGDYGSDDDARLDYKEDRANARLRNKEQREARQKQKLAATEAPPTIPRRSTRLWLAGQQKRQARIRQVRQEVMEQLETKEDYELI